MKHSRAFFTNHQNRPGLLASAVIAIVFVFLGISSIPLEASTQNRQQERVIRKLHSERNEPVDITKIKVKGLSIKLNEKLLSDDDWLNDLTITIKNKSDKAILFASIDLLFPKPSGVPGRIAVNDISYGNRALLERSPATADLSAGLMPGQA